MLKIVFDSNVYLSAVLSGGNPGEILNLAKEKKIQIFLSEYIIGEITRILKEKLHWQDFDIRNVLDDIKEVSTLVFPTDRVDIIKLHQEDNRILECGLVANADYLISGDKKHILPLKKFQGIKIVSPKEFLEIFCL